MLRKTEVFLGDFSVRCSKTSCYEPLDLVPELLSDLLPGEVIFCFVT